MQREPEKQPDGPAILLEKKVPWGRPRYQENSQIARRQIPKKGSCSSLRETLPAAAQNRGAIEDFRPCFL